MGQGHTPGSSDAARRWGFAATLVLALGAWAVSVVQMDKARNDVRGLARTADRSTYLVGELGRQISRLRAETMELLVPENDADDTYEDLRTITTALDAALSELEPLLQPEEERMWSRFVPLLVRFRHHDDAAIAAAKQGDDAHARSILTDEVNPLENELQGCLDDLARFNEERSARSVAAADATLARVMLVETVLGAGLLIGLAAIWLTALSTLARQRRKLEEYVARVESSNRDLDAFAGRIAHDLGNALAPVGFGAAALRRLAGRPESVARIAAQLDATMQRTRGLIAGLLAFSRAGRGTASSEVAHVAPTLESVLEELAPLAARVDATLDVALADAVVACPPGLLHVVAANLLGNALKFLAGRPLRRATVTARTVDDRWCELTIADTGPGIPRESLQRIFEPFYRVPGTVVEGTGIGLATVHRIVTAHGGTIAVESEVGRGTAFRVRLRLAEQRPPAEHAPVDVGA
jgi:signal transduction histidine kinase